MEMTNKKVMVIFDDGQSISKHIGIHKGKDGEFLYLFLLEKKVTEAIQISKIIRVEVIE